MAYLRNEDTIADSDAHGQAVALLVEETGADGQDLGLVQLLDAGLGQEDAAGGLGLGLDALDQDAVQKRGEGTDGSDGGGLCQFACQFIPTTRRRFVVECEAKDCRGHTPAGDIWEVRRPALRRRGTNW